MLTTSAHLDCLSEGCIRVRRHVCFHLCHSSGVALLELPASFSHPAVSFCLGEAEAIALATSAHVGDLSGRFISVGHPVCEAMCSCLSAFAYLSVGACFIPFGAGRAELAAS